MPRASKSRCSSDSTSWSKSLVIVGEICPEKKNVHSVSKCHDPLRAEDGIIDVKCADSLEKFDFNKTT